MVKFNIYFIVILVLYQFFIIGNNPKLAVVIVPVADATAHIINTDRSITDIYNELPCSSKINSRCLRVHQLLFNEIVKVKKIEGKQVKVELSNVYYISKNQKKINFFWTLKKNLLIFDESINQSKIVVYPNKQFSNNQRYKLIKFENQFNIDSILKFIPKIYVENFSKNIPPINNQIILKYPWYDIITKKTYSIGTNFVRLSNLDNEDNFAIYILDTENLDLLESNLNKKIVKIRIALIPKNICIEKYPNRSSDKINGAINLLYDWSLKIGIIPYVLGGSSCTLTYDNLEKYYQNCYLDDGFWYIKDSKLPYSGFDCTNLILKAMQLNGMPYFFKNTSTLLGELKPLTNEQFIDSGDLIVWPGHVLVVGNIEKNEIIEAGGFDAGYGKIQIVKLEKYFKSVKSFKELLFKYKNNVPIDRLHKNGWVMKKNIYFKILKINSLK